VRPLLIVAAVCAVACDLDSPAPAPTPAPRAAPRVSADQAQRKRKECRDTCEQTAIIVGGTDAQLRACRARCDRESAATVAPVEVPSRITRAPAVRSPPAVRPVESR
jgi:hypothetical protein